jgi:hypothetical protein
MDSNKHLDSGICLSVFHQAILEIEYEMSPAIRSLCLHMKVLG